DDKENGSVARSAGGRGPLEKAGRTRTSPFANLRRGLSRGGQGPFEQQRRWAIDQQPCQRRHPMAKGRKKLDDLFHDTLKDIYFAEKKILTALPKMAKAAQVEELKAACAGGGALRNLTLRHAADLG